MCVEEMVHEDEEVVNDEEVVHKEEVLKEEMHEKVVVSAHPVAASPLLSKPRAT